jgi:hypothetical protein
MHGNYQEFRIFLSSPGDVQDERKIAKSIIHDVGRVCKGSLQLNLELIRWEDMAPMTPTEGTIQDKINESIKKCHVFVLILDKRFGQIEEGYNESNTEREVEAAFALKKNNKKIKFLAYFKNLG